ncbi:collagen-like triple helix repeat-containing protein [Neisseria sp. P0017.S007]|uniref:collagen-like triple helix repeat-containing protein n=1 Tax=unclassified Neisseria TaxID=2623750 RepID=UPI003F8050E0
MTEYVFTLSDKTPSVEIDVKETAIAQGAGQDLYDRAKRELGFTGTFEEFLASFKGDTGERGIQGERGTDGLPGAKGDTGATGAPGANGLPGVKGDTGERGHDGKSAYEIAVANGYVGSEEAWLYSLKGRDGSPGRDGRNGLSAYELADGELLFGTVGKWLESLKGATGAKGDNGDTGAAGKSATVTIGTVTTGEAASVTNTGTATEAVLNFVLPAGGGGQSNGLHTEIKTVPVTVSAQSIQTVEFEAKFAETPTLHGQPALMGAGENRFLYLLSVDKNGFTCRSNYFSAGVQTIHYAVTGKLA